MVSESGPRITVRDAKEADIFALTAIKGERSETVHQDRLRDAENASIRYLVLLEDQEIIGFAYLVFRRPSYWSDAGDTEHLPYVIDLQVKESQIDSRPILIARHIKCLESKLGGVKDPH